jgi:hypothetical protein
MERSGSLELRAQRLPAGSVIRDRCFSKVVLEDCWAEAVPQDRARIESCEFEQVRLSKCTLGTIVFRECTFDAVRSDFLATYNALFLRCALKGEIKGVNFGIRPDLYDPERNAVIRADNTRLLAGTNYCLDVRDAKLTEVLFQGQDIVRWVMFYPGQCAVFRGSKDLAGQLKSAKASLPPGDARKSLVRANVFPGEDSALVALPLRASGGLLEELKQILAPYGVEVLGEPLASI